MKISKEEVWDSVTTSLLEMTDRMSITDKNARTKAAANEARARFAQYKKDRGIRTTEDLVKEFASEDEQKDPKWVADSEKRQEKEFEDWEREQGGAETDALLPENPYEPTDFAPPENQQGMRAWEADQGIELGPIDTAAKPLTEMMHEFSEFDGLVGTEAFNTKTPGGLKNILSKLEDIKWKTEMEMTPVDQALSAQLEFKRDKQTVSDMDNALEYRSVQLETVLPESELSLAQQMKGTNVKPFDWDYYSRAKAEPAEPLVEMLEMRIDLSDLPAPGGPELSSSMVPLEVMETQFGPGSKPNGFESFVEENFGRPDLGESELMLGEESEMSMLPTLSEIGESLATIGELLPTSDMIMGFLEGGLMMAIPIQLVTELIPLFTEMANGQWMIPGGKEKMNMLAYHDEINRGHEGDFYIRRNKIQEYYKNNPCLLYTSDAADE